MEVLWHFPHILHQQLGTGVFLHLHGPDSRMEFWIRDCLWLGSKRFLSSEGSVLEEGGGQVRGGMINAMIWEGA